MKIKRILTYIFTVAMIVSILAVPAFAAESDLVPVNVGAWNLNQLIGVNGNVTTNVRYAATSNFIDAKYESYMYTGELIDSNGETLLCYIAEYDSEKNFICRTLMNTSTERYEVFVSTDCVYIRFTFGRALSSMTSISASDLNYFAVGGSGVKTDKNFVSMLNAIGEVFANVLEWVVLTISTITTNNILLLSCVALPLCGLGVGMFTRIVRSRG